jgi:hypothetical protein
MGIGHNPIATKQALKCWWRKLPREHKESHNDVAIMEIFVVTFFSKFTLSLFNKDI